MEYISICKFYGKGIKQTANYCGECLTIFKEKYNFIISKEFIFIINRKRCYNHILTLKSQIFQEQDHGI